jgi:hypothetical protein
MLVLLACQHAALKVCGAPASHWQCSWQHSSKGVGQQQHNVPTVAFNGAAGDVRLFVCCNDNTIKVYSLPSMDSVTVIR